jgi:N-acyl-D-amino-acid deacylase
MYDILIKNGLVIDGSGKPGVMSDVAIVDGLITDIAPNMNEKKATTIINAKDKFVTPGFIDIQNHSDSYWTLFEQPEQKSLLAQGITTIVTGNCGASLAPLSNADTLKTFQKWHNLTGINVNWSSFNELLATLDALPKGVNVASLVGHGTLRRGLLGDQARTASPDEIHIMENLLMVALREGGMGMSMGLVYAHEVDSTTEELVKLSSHLKNQDKYLSVHLRSEGGQVLDAVDEVIDLAARCEIPVKISHLKIRNKKNWHLFDRIINKLENAYHQGLDVTFDVYPYSSSWSVLYTYLPRWAYEGGRAEIVRRLSTQTDRRKIGDYLKDQEYDYGSMVIATAEKNTGFIGKTIQEVATNNNVSNEDALMDIVAATQAQVIVFDHNLSDENVELFLTSPLSMVATDGAGYNSETEHLVHPRCFGTMPAFLRMVREKNLMRWEQAIRKITGEPARLLKLNDRGTLTPQSKADIVVFDPATITDKASYAHPFRFPMGIENVIVNGKLAWSDNMINGMFGQVIRR